MLRERPFLRVILGSTTITLPCDTVLYVFIQWMVILPSSYFCSSFSFTFIILSPSSLILPVYFQFVRPTRGFSALFDERLHMDTEEEEVEEDPEVQSKEE